MAGKKQKRSKKVIPNMGNCLSCLNDEQARDLLNKYQKVIYYQCKKISFIPGMDIEDLMQECRLKILSGYHLFKKKKSSEKTWINNVVRNTLYGIWDLATKEIRSCHVETEEGLVPVYNYSFDSFFEDSAGEGDSVSFEEIYEGSPDSRPVFGTQTYRQDDLLFLINVLEMLKDRLSSDTYKFIRNLIYPESSFKDIIKLEEKFRQNLISEGFTRVKPKDDFEIYFQLTKVPLEKLTMLCQTGEVLVGELGFKKEEIMKHEDMIDANF